MAYAHAKFEVATYNGLGRDAFIRKHMVLCNVSCDIDFQSKPSINLKIFATVHSPMKDIHLIDRALPSSVARATRFEHRINSLEVTLVLRLTANHT